MKLEKCPLNPILKPNPKNAWESLCVLNPAVIYDEDRQEFAMLYRAAGNDEEHRIYLGLATSKDGIHFQRMSDAPALAPDLDGTFFAVHGDAGIVADVLARTRIVVEQRRLAAVGIAGKGKTEALLVLALGLCGRLLLTHEKTLQKDAAAAGRKAGGRRRMHGKRKIWNSALRRRRPEGIENAVLPVQNRRREACK